MEYSLPTLILLPLLGGIIGAFVPARVAKTWALIVSFLTLAVAVWLSTGFSFAQDLSDERPDYRLSRTLQVEFGSKWHMREGNPLSIPQIGFSFQLAADTISLWLVLLTGLLTPLAIAASFASIRDREKEYYAWMLVLLSAMMGVFVARDLLLFYLFFELTLIPMFFIIGIWGGPERRYAAAKFFLFTFAGSVFTLAGIVYLGLNAKSFDLTDVTVAAQQQLTDTQRFWVLLAFLAGFAVKVPLFPVHTWLPLAHTEAPTAGSVILAGVLLKLGTYGLLRLAVPIGLIGAGGLLFPTVVKAIAALCIIGIIYGALVAWVQRDIKKLVAYSSVSHLGFCVLGLVALGQIGIQGSVLYMINHGLSTGALFLVVGMIYDRYHTRDIDELGGLSRVMPRLAFFFVLFTLSSIGLPGLNGFVSEFLTVLGAFTSDHLGIGYGALAALGVILGAVYMLHMVARVLFGPLKLPAGHHADRGAHGPAKNDIGAREVAILVPIAVCCVVLGIGSTFVTRSMHWPIEMIYNPLPRVDQSASRQQDRAQAIARASGSALRSE
jgi:NADH-quinone oxidoreductase subunit M